MSDINKSNPGSLFLGLWMVFVTFVILIYTCNLRAFLAKRKFSQPIDPTENALSQDKKIYMLVSDGQHLDYAAEDYPGFDIKRKVRIDHFKFYPSIKVLFSKVFPTSYVLHDSDGLLGLNMTYVVEAAKGEAVHEDSMSMIADRPNGKLLLSQI